MGKSGLRESPWGDGLNIQGRHNRTPAPGQVGPCDLCTESKLYSRPRRSHWRAYHRRHSHHTSWPTWAYAQRSYTCRLPAGDRHCGLMFGTCTAAFVGMVCMDPRPSLFVEGRSRMHTAVWSFLLVVAWDLSALCSSCYLANLMPSGSSLSSLSGLKWPVSFPPFVHKHQHRGLRRLTSIGRWLQAHFYFCTIVHVSHLRMATSLPRCDHII